jgi:hypothetical protein
VDHHLEAIMELNRGGDATTGRVLAVADWTTDPQAIVAACVERQERSGGDFALLVPAWLHGLDWVGDPPQASRAPTDSSPRSAVWPTRRASCFTPRASATPTL